MLKVVSKRLEAAVNKNRRSWQSYRTEKKRILSLKRVTESEKRIRLKANLDNTYQKISSHYKSYREFKHSKIYVSEVPDFNYIRGLRTENTQQKFFKAKSNFDTSKLDVIIPEYLDKKNVKGVMVIQEIYNKKLDHKMNVSKYITKANLDKARGNIYDYMNSSVINLKRYEGYKMKNIQIRVIYESAKKS